PGGLEVQAGAPAAGRAPDREPQPRRAQRSREALAVRKGFEARGAAAELRVEPAPRECAAPPGVDETAAPLLVEFRPRRETLPARLLESGEELRRQRHRQPPRGGGRGAAARTGRVADGRGGQ